MSNNISPYVGSQLPEYLRGNSPLFTAFIETYYKYVELRENSIGMIQNRALDADIDETLDKYVSEFYATYGEYIPTAIALDRRNFIKLLNDIYNAKGTQKSLQLLFRAIFNQDIKISYPSEQILRASDGVWEIEKFITVVTKFGINPVEGDTIIFTNDFGDFVLEISKIIQINPTTCRIYFKSYSSIKVVDSQLIYIYNINGDITYVGGLIKSPSKLVVSDGGKAWQVGQIITIDGNGIDTIARIVSVDSVNGISGLEILEFGIHNENQIVLISPYPNRPVSSNLEVESILVSTSPNVYQHNITIRDYTDGIFERIYGVGDGVDEKSYFLDDEYVNRGYFGTVTIDQISSVIPPSIGQSTGINIQEWLDSRATLIYTFDNLVSTRGYFSNENGQLSNQFIRSQDNYFYQPFSYVIETKLDIREYENILNISHPAGTKRFSILERGASYQLPVTWSRTISLDTVYFSDSYAVFDINNITFGKSLIDSVSTSDMKTIVLNKGSMADSVVATSLDVTNIVTTGYDTGTYSTGTYSAFDYTITIG